MMLQSRLTSKGQTTIPAEIRALLKAGPGDTLNYVVRNGQVILSAKTGSVMDLVGIARGILPGPLTDDELEDLIAEAAVLPDPED